MLSAQDALKCRVNQLTASNEFSENEDESASDSIWIDDIAPLQRHSNRSSCNSLNSKTPSSNNYTATTAYTTSALVSNSEEEDDDDEEEFWSNPFGEKKNETMTSKSSLQQKRKQQQHGSLEISRSSCSKNSMTSNNFSRGSISSNSCSKNSISRKKDSNRVVALGDFLAVNNDKDTRKSRLNSHHRKPSKENALLWKREPSSARPSRKKPVQKSRSLDETLIGMEAKVRNDRQMKSLMPSNGNTASHHRRKLPDKKKSRSMDEKLIGMEAKIRKDKQLKSRSDHGGAETRTHTRRPRKGSKDLSEHNNSVRSETLKAKDKDGEDPRLCSSLTGISNNRSHNMNLSSMKNESSKKGGLYDHIKQNKEENCDPKQEDASTVSEETNVSSLSSLFRHLKQNTTTNNSGHQQKKNPPTNNSDASSVSSAGETASITVSKFKKDNYGNNSENHCSASLTLSNLHNHHDSTVTTSNDKSSSSNNSTSKVITIGLAANQSAPVNVSDNSVSGDSKASAFSEQLGKLASSLSNFYVPDKKKDLVRGSSSSTINDDEDNKQPFSLLLSEQKIQKLFGGNRRKSLTRATSAESVLAKMNSTITEDSLIRLTKMKPKSTNDSSTGPIKNNKLVLPVSKRKLTRVLSEESIFKKLEAVSSATSTPHGSSNDLTAMASTSLQQTTAKALATNSLLSRAASSSKGKQRKTRVQNGERSSNLNSSWARVKSCRNFNGEKKHNNNDDSLSGTRKHLRRAELNRAESLDINYNYKKSQVSKLSSTIHGNKIQPIDLKRANSSNSNKKSNPSSGKSAIGLQNSVKSDTFIKANSNNDDDSLKDNQRLFSSLSGINNNNSESLLSANILSSKLTERKHGLYDHITRNDEDDEEERRQSKQDDDSTHPYENTNASSLSNLFRHLNHFSGQKEKAVHIASADDTPSVSSSGETASITVSNLKRNSHASTSKNNDCSISLTLSNLNHNSTITTNTKSSSNNNSKVINIGRVANNSAPVVNGNKNNNQTKASAFSEQLDKFASSRSNFYVPVKKKDLLRGTSASPVHGDEGNKDVRPFSEQKSVKLFGNRRRSLTRSTSAESVLTKMKSTIAEDSLIRLTKMNPKTTATSTTKTAPAKNDKIVLPVGKRKITRALSDESIFKKLDAVSSTATQKGLNDTADASLNNSSWAPVNNYEHSLKADSRLSSSLSGLKNDNSISILSAVNSNAKLSERKRGLYDNSAEDDDNDEERCQPNQDDEYTNSEDTNVSSLSNLFHHLNHYSGQEKKVLHSSSADDISISSSGETASITVSNFKRNSHASTSENNCSSLLTLSNLNQNSTINTNIKSSSNNDSKMINIGRMANRSAPFVNGNENNGESKASVFSEQLDKFASSRSNFYVPDKKRDLLRGSSASPVHGDEGNKDVRPFSEHKSKKLFANRRKSLTRSTSAESVLTKMKSTIGEDSLIRLTKMKPSTTKGSTTNAAHINNDKIVLPVGRRTRTLSVESIFKKLDAVSSTASQKGSNNVSDISGLLQTASEVTPAPAKDSLSQDNILNPISQDREVPRNNASWTRINSCRNFSSKSKHNTTSIDLQRAKSFSLNAHQNSKKKSESISASSTKVGSNNNSCINNSGQSNKRKIDLSHHLTTLYHEQEQIRGGSKQSLAENSADFHQSFSTNLSDSINNLFSPFTPYIEDEQKKLASTRSRSKALFKEHLKKVASSFSDTQKLFDTNNINCCDGGRRRRGGVIRSASDESLFAVNKKTSSLSNSKTRNMHSLITIPTHIGALPIARGLSRSSSDKSIFKTYEGVSNIECNDEEKHLNEALGTAVTLQEGATPSNPSQVLLNEETRKLNILNKDANNNGDLKTRDEKLDLKTIDIDIEKKSSLDGHLSKIHETKMMPSPNSFSRRSLLRSTSQESVLVSPKSISSTTTTHSATKETLMTRRKVVRTYSDESIFKKVDDKSSEIKALLRQGLETAELLRNAQEETSQFFYSETTEAQNDLVSQNYDNASTASTNNYDEQADNFSLRARLCRTSIINNAQPTNNIERHEEQSIERMNESFVSEETASESMSNLFCPLNQYNNGKNLQKVAKTNIGGSCASSISNATLNNSVNSLDLCRHFANNNETGRSHDDQSVADESVSVSFAAVFSQFGKCGDKKPAADSSVTERTASITTFSSSNNSSRWSGSTQNSSSLVDGFGTADSKRNGRSSSRQKDRSLNISTSSGFSSSHDSMHSSALNFTPKSKVRHRN